MTFHNENRIRIFHHQPRKLKHAQPGGIFHHRLVVFKKKIRSQPAVPAVLAQGGLGHELGKRFAPIRQMGIILTARPFELIVIPFIRIHHVRFSRLDCNRTGGRFQHLRRRGFGQPLCDGIHVHLRHFRGKGFRGGRTYRIRGKAGFPRSNHYLLRKHIL